MNKVITRFAPSPTGFLHIGSARSALFNYLFAKQNGGQVLLRIEDTDKERNKPEYTTSIIKGFEWLGITFDSLAIQSDNFGTHKKYLEKLIESGHAYVSKETPTEPGQRDEVIRFKNPNKKVVFNDLIKGPIEFDTTELKDFIIAKSLDEPIFHLSNVVDDITMGITHVIRGEEHLSNTPRQILIWEAIGEKPLPIYGHIPLILAENREKISKRKHGEIVSVEYYQKLGYLPEALLNFLVLLGWNPGDNTEMINLADMVKLFNISKVQKAGAIFNTQKLNWFNHEYIMKMDREAFSAKAKPFLPDWLKDDISTFEKLLSLFQEKIVCFSDITKLLEANGELSFVHDFKDFSAELILWKKNPDKEQAIRHLEFIKGAFLEVASENFRPTQLKDILWKYAEEHGKGEVLWPMRFSLTGQEKSPDPFTVAGILGKEESLMRIDLAINKLKGKS